MNATDLAIWKREAEPGHPSVLLIHGLTGNSRWWEVLIEHLPSDLGFVAPDLRGRGASWRLPGPWGIRRHADDLAEIVQELGIGPLVIAGYSMGAWVATLLATRHPELVSAVVAVDGGLRLQAPKGLSNTEAVEAVVGPSVSGLAMRFASADEYTAHWEAHPAIAPYLPEVATPNAQYSLAGEEPEMQVRANRVAVTQDGTEFLLDEEVITAAQRVSQPMTLITVDHGLLDRPGGFMSPEAVEEATSSNQNIAVRALRDTNHYTLMLGKGVPRVAAAIEDTIASVAT